MSGGPYGFDPAYYAGGPTGIAEIEIATYAVMLLLFFLNFRRDNSAATASIRALAGASFAAFVVSILAFISNFNGEEALVVAIVLSVFSGMAAILLCLAGLTRRNRSHG